MYSSTRVPVRARTPSTYTCTYEPCTYVRTSVWRLTWAPRWYRITFTSTHHPRFPQLSCWRDYGRLNGPLQVPVVLSLIIIVLGEQHRFRPNGTGTAANDERWPALVKTTAASGDHSQHSTTLPQHLAPSHSRPIMGSTGSTGGGTLPPLPARTQDAA